MIPHVCYVFQILEWLLSLFVAVYSRSWQLKGGMMVVLLRHVYYKSQRYLYTKSYTSALSPKLSQICSWKLKFDTTQILIGIDIPFYVQSISFLCYTRTKTKRPAKLKLHTTYTCAYIRTQVLNTLICSIFLISR